MRRLLLATACVALGASAFAYHTFDEIGVSGRWPGARCTMYHDPNWPLSGTYVNELQGAMSVWTAVEGSNFTFLYGGPSPSANVRDTANGNSDVLFDSLSANTYAITWITDLGANLSDRDVVFNTAWQWNVAPGAPVHFRSVCVHELGHVVGLDHETAVPAVMYPYYDGTSRNDSLQFDDEEGCRFLYPEPPPPPPPPSDADLVLDSVTFGPEDATDGDEIDVTFSFRNAGTDATGAFAATVYLAEGATVTPADRYLRAAIQGSLDPGAARTVTVHTRLPDALEPRIYRIGVILDAQQAVGDRDRNNNAGVATHVLQGGGELVRIGPGYRVQGTLVSFGHAAFLMDLAAGTNVKVKAQLEGGTLELVLEDEESGEPVVERRRLGRANARLRVPRDGTYRVRLASENAAVSRYELSVGSNTIRRRGALNVTQANRVELPGYLGCYVDARIRAQGDVRPTAEWIDVETQIESRGGGRRLRLRPTLVTTTGPLFLTLTQGEGPPGPVRYDIRERVPRKGPLIRR